MQQQQQILKQLKHLEPVVIAIVIININIVMLFHKSNEVPLQEKVARLF